MKRDKEFTIVQIVHLDDTGDTRYRMLWPSQNLATQAPLWRIINVAADCAQRFELGINADLLVSFQSHDQELYDLILERKKRGLKTLVEYNDNFYHPQPWSPVAEAWQSPQLRNTYEQFMHAADGVLVTGPGLARLFPTVTKTPVFILENHLPVAPPSREDLKRKKTHYPSFGWAGSLGHMGDLLAFVPVIHEILTEVPGSKFHVMGNEAIPDLIGVSKDRIVYTPWGSMEQYYEFWEKVHVGIAPLLRTPYNECRSDIKALEMSSRGAAPILSKELPYELFAQKTAIELYNSFHSIKNQAVSLLKNSKLLEEFIQRCHRYVVSERIQTGRTERLELYEQFLPETGSPVFSNIQRGYVEVHQPKQSEQKKRPDPLLLKILNAATQNDIEAGWSELFAKLRTQSEDEIAAEEKVYSKLMIRSLDRYPGLLHVADALLEFSPYLHGLRMKVAHLYEVIGENKKSLSHYEVVLQNFKIFKRGGEELSQQGRGYLEAWVAALNARIEQGYGSGKKR